MARDASVAYGLRQLMKADADKALAKRELQTVVEELRRGGFGAGTVACAVDAHLEILIERLRGNENLDGIGGNALKRSAVEHILTMNDQEIVEVGLKLFLQFASLEAIEAKFDPAGNLKREQATNDRLEAFLRDRGLGKEIDARRQWELQDGNRPRTTMDREEEYRHCRDRIGEVISGLGSRDIRDISIFGELLEALHDLIMRDEWADCRIAFMRELAPRYERHRRDYAERFERLRLNSIALNSMPTKGGVH